ncbi:MAG: hypothetical protein DI527_16495 [Chelatococcus sp.]|nr:MAG: hypothetical protein DI527_16495 [Chelatococcus sp.]
MAIAVPTVSAYDRATKTLTGIAQPAASIAVYVDGVQSGTTVANGAGVWSFAFGAAPGAGSALTATQTVPKTSSMAPGLVVPEASFSLANLPAGALIANWDARVASSLTLSGSQVAAWTDQNAALVLAQATAGMRPTYSATGWDGVRPAISFDGNFNTGQGDILTLVASLSERYWVFALLERSAANQNNGAGSNLKNILQVFRPSDGLFASLAFLRPNSDASQTTILTTGFGTSSNTVAAPGGGLANGAKGLVFADMGRAIGLNSGTLGKITNVGSGTKAEIALGGDSAVDHNRGAFKLAQLVLVDPLKLKGDGADNQRWVIEGWLAHEWGQAGLLPALHPFKAAPPLVSDWTDNAREIVTWGNSLTLGFTPSIVQAWASGYLTLPPVTNGGIGGNTSTAVRTRFDAADPRLHECDVVIGEVFENGNGGGSNPTTREHISHMVATVLAAGGRPIVLDRHIDNLDAYAIGQATRAEVEADNAWLQANFPDYYLPICDFVHAMGAPDGPYPDPVNYAKGLPPAGAMRDNVHYVDDVYQRVGRDRIGGHIKTKRLDR